MIMVTRGVARSMMAWILRVAGRLLNGKRRSGWCPHAGALAPRDTCDLRAERSIIRGQWRLHAHCAKAQGRGHWRSLARPVPVTSAPNDSGGVHTGTESSARLALASDSYAHSGSGVWHRPANFFLESILTD
jgi:hypothetical protein